MRRAFTLVEILVVIAIIGLMATVGAVSLTAGRKAARVRGAARNVVSMVRHARSSALVSQKPTVITFANETLDGEPIARVTVDTAQITHARTVDRAETLSSSAQISLSGDPEPEPVTKTRAFTVNGESPVVEEESAAESVFDFLFEPVSDDVVTGIRVKVVTGDEAEHAVSSGDAKVRTSSSLSVFSTADYVLGEYRKAKESEKKQTEESEAKDADEKKSSAAAADEMTAPVSLVWQVNGRCEPHNVWVYADGSTPEEGLLIRVDRFGGIKVLSGDGSEEED